MIFWSSFRAILLLSSLAAALVSHNETDTGITLSSDYLSFTVNKTWTAITDIIYNGEHVLGVPDYNPATRLGMFYYDCYCIPNAVVESPTNFNPAGSRKWYTGESGNQTFQTYYGTDLSNTSWAAVVMSETYAPTGQFFQQYWFLRDGETGLHTFSRLAYLNSLYSDHNVTNLGNVQELRQILTPNTPIWTHLVTNPTQYGNLPSANATKNETVVQDATWYLANTPNEPYVKEQSDYFTKYEWQDHYQYHKAHGFFADGSHSGNSTMGLWAIQNYEGYSGGPGRSDLLVDNSIYDYYLSNHGGTSTMNLTTGFDRIFGPTFFYLNRGGDLPTLLADAESYSYLSNSDVSADFYDSIAWLVPGYAPTTSRGNLTLNITLPSGAGTTTAVLSAIGVDPQDALDPSVYQYWANVSSNGTATIPRVRAGSYRLTVYSNGIFGDYHTDKVIIQAGNTTSIAEVWEAESAGVEVFRIGVPDKTAGEYRHGFATDLNRTNHPQQYRSYWGYWDFPTDFPNGVNYTVGVSDYSVDWNYIHFSRYGHTYPMRLDTVVVNNVNEWQINFAVSGTLLTNKDSKKATFTVQLAGARTPSGNTDIPEPSSNNSDLAYSVYVNDHAPMVWTIPYNASSSCSQRSGIGCYLLKHKFEFEGDHLNEGWNKMILALPFNSSGGDVNFRDFSVDVMYDAVRLELSD